MKSRVSSLLSKAGIASTLLLSSIIIGCSGSSSSTPPPPSTTLSGVAAAGAPIIGTVIIKGALGNTNSALIEADGSYDVDVTGLTAPYRLRAQGSVGGRQYKLHSYAIESDVGGTVNITPFTDLIIANVAGQIAETFFDQAQQINPLDETIIEEQEAELQAKLQDVFNAVGVGTAIDLLRTTFSADHSGLDAALDIVRVEQTSANIVTITNLVENTSITDDVTDTTDNTETLTVTDPVALQTTATDTQQIAALFDAFSAAYATGLPTGSTLTAVENTFATDFLEDGYNKSLFLTEITTDPEMIGSIFSGIVVSNLDSIAGTAEVTFSWGANGVLEPEPETWFVAKDATLGWQFRGDQRIVETYFSFHCNDYDGFVADNPNGWTCGINTQYWDEDPTVNPGGTVIASGTVRILDANTQAQKAIIYLGTPAGSTAGNVQVYNEANQGFQGDYRELANNTGGTDPSIFAVGDIIEYALYTADLDISTPASPAVVGIPVATYTDTLAFLPNPTTWSDSSNKMPTATSATQSAIQGYSTGNNLTIGWDLSAGTRIEEVLVRITDSAGDQVEVWDWMFGSTATSVTYSAASLDTSALLQTDTAYELRVRIYAQDEVNGQSHSKDYAYNIAGPAAQDGSGIACDPTGVTTLAEFETIMDACGTVTPMVANDLAGNSYTFVAATNEVTTFNLDGSTGSFTNDGGNTAIPLTWSIDSRGYLTVNYTVPNVGTFFDVMAAYGVDTSTGGLMVRAFTNENNSTFSEIIIPVGGGSSTSLTCGYSTPWDDVADEPSSFNSYDDFLTVVADCGGASPTTTADIIGTWTDTWTDGSTGALIVVTMVFNGDGSTGTYSETADGVPLVNGSGSFTWSVANNLLTVNVAGVFMEVTAVTASGMVHYAEDAEWSTPSDLSISNTATLDGEIWNGNYVKQP
ncbi:MAG: hypothetical protein DIZ80_03620 [endosymbiont of Galathealinum brachiosum]|uniref:Fibronectin type-III domain-containing protein n=1 Tax=endosymbiont of Galathealinum brachiosum TaxID=2200906 RepID=A0A370DI13_9GAMM|nr:MAG: hypothetical protein DIZ80_03620 [endosymbiont of Galathealinum brachiosum]